MKLEQASDIARLQDANIYALKNTASQSDLKRFMELRNANEKLAELQAMYYDLEQYKETVDDVITCVTSISKDLLNIGYGNNKATNLKEVFNSLLDDIQEGIEDYQNTIKELEG